MNLGLRWPAGAPFKIPSRWSLVEQPLPRNAAGKMLKTALRDQAAAVD
ncbi:MAG: hypothetical protein R2704_10290 [Microthrixaceae bacterium]